MKPTSNDKLFLSVEELIEKAQVRVVRHINLMMVATHFQIGRMIVEDEQDGQTYATYGAATIAKLSEHLTGRFGRGYSPDNLDLMRSFYHEYRNSGSLIRISEAGFANSESLIRNLAAEFGLSWTHYVRLMKIKDINERKFYELEANTNNWSVRELQRQINSSCYERLVLSGDKKRLKDDMAKGTITEPVIDALKTPFVLEFLSLKEDSSYSENDLETAIIDKLEHFMLELGKGFLFEGRQRRITLEGDHFWVDLVFYNRLLDCFVLIDLKIGKLTHQDIGQMQMYVNYYDRKVKRPHEKPTLGIILCKEDNQAVVEYTLPLNNEQIFSREYKLYLPTKEELQKQLL
ncbi:DUF1016 family protein [Mucilaginibacter sp. 21P]|uniref:PDDEXK nuclease domain-containing protein n=1 Tax=Mucilaginibacter sp. 21P TaxID=2778902 RepID=UPI001C57871B|nr:PDDEXK nuclease domain-containing protein [Mucilaginibacter sp. 21P]QXV64039.1 DUF1016 family protein [Mucilaginibacter sp. 21P]